MMKKLYIIALAALSTLAATAQVGVGTTTPQAALDVTASNMGMLVPRVALTDTQTTAPVTNPESETLVNGTLVYNTGTAGTAPNNVVPGFYYWQDSTWVAVKGVATLDAAYDGAGSGAGRVITADAGPVKIDGQGGFLVSGTEDGSIQPILAAGSHLMFNPARSAFRAGYVDNDIFWSNENVGEYSTAFGLNTRATGGVSFAIGHKNIASGMYSFASGYNSTASGSYSIAWGSSSNALKNFSVSFGESTNSRSVNEFVIGRYNTDYDPVSPNFFDVNDRLFIIGKGSSTFRSDAMIVYKSGNLMIGGNTASKPGGGTWTATSDSRLKKDVKQFKDGLAQVLAINPVNYHYNELSGLDTSKEFVGVIAQELQKVAPYMVGNFTKDGTEYLNVDSSAMTYMLINAVKEQQEIIEKQNKRLDVLEAALLRLTAEEKSAPATGNPDKQVKK